MPLTVSTGDVTVVEKEIKKAFVDAFKKTDDDFLKEAGRAWVTEIDTLLTWGPVSSTFSCFCSTQTMRLEFPLSWVMIMSAII